MKKFLFGVFALLLAFGAVAFTKEDKSAKTGSYWFQLDVGGNPIATTTQPVLSAPDPYACPGGTVYCARGYSTFQTIPGTPVTYQASGTGGAADKKN